MEGIVAIITGFALFYLKYRYVGAQFAIDSSQEITRMRHRGTGGRHGRESFHLAGMSRFAGVTFRASQGTLGSLHE